MFFFFFSSRRRHTRYWRDWSSDVCLPISGLPLAGQVGSLRKRFVDTPLAGRVRAKDGSIGGVNSLSGFPERPDGRVWTFSVQANHHALPGRAVIAQIDSVVVDLGKLR